MAMHRDGDAGTQLPFEVFDTAIRLLDGHSLLACCAVSSEWSRRIGEDWTLWRDVCKHAFGDSCADPPRQLAGAPDLDAITLYCGDYRRMFVDRARDTYAGLGAVPVGEFVWHIPHFGRYITEDADQAADLPNDGPLAAHGCMQSPVFEVPGKTAARGSAKATRQVQDGSPQWQGTEFKCWLYPRGNPGEETAAEKCLSVYLVSPMAHRLQGIPGLLQELGQERLRGGTPWMRSAVFEFAVLSHKGEDHDVVWESSLSSTRFDATRFNWGTHSLAELAAIRDPERGLLSAGLDVATRAPWAPLGQRPCHVDGNGLTLRVRVRFLSLAVQFFDECSLLGPVRLRTASSADSSADVAQGGDTSADAGAAAGASDTSATTKNVTGVGLDWGRMPTGFGLGSGAIGALGNAQAIHRPTPFAWRGRHRIAPPPGPRARLRNLVQRYHWLHSYDYDASWQHLASNYKQRAAADAADFDGRGGSTGDDAASGSGKGSGSYPTVTSSATTDETNGRSVSLVAAHSPLPNDVNETEDSSTDNGSADVADLAADSSDEILPPTIHHDDIARLLRWLIRQGSDPARRGDLQWTSRHDHILGLFRDEEVADVFRGLRSDAQEASAVRCVHAQECVRAVLARHALSCEEEGHSVGDTFLDWHGSKHICLMIVRCMLHASGLIHDVHVPNTASNLTLDASSNACAGTDNHAYTSARRALPWTRDSFDPKKSTLSGAHTRFEHSYIHHQLRYSGEGVIDDTTSNDDSYCSAAVHMLRPPQDSSTIVRIPFCATLQELRIAASRALPLLRHTRPWPQQCTSTRAQRPRRATLRCGHMIRLVLRHARDYIQEHEYVDATRHRAATIAAIPCVDATVEDPQCAGIIVERGVVISIRLLESLHGPHSNGSTVEPGPPQCPDKVSNDHNPVHGGPHIAHEIRIARPDRSTLRFVWPPRRRADADALRLEIEGRECWDWACQSRPTLDLDGARQVNELDLELSLVWSGAHVSTVDTLVRSFASSDHSDDTIIESASDPMTLHVSQYDRDYWSGPFKEVRFTLYALNQPLLRHKPLRPRLRLGRGTVTYKRVRGARRQRELKKDTELFNGFLEDGHDVDAYGRCRFFVEASTDRSWWIFGPDGVHHFCNLQHLHAQPEIFDTHHEFGADQFEQWSAGMQQEWSSVVAGQIECVEATVQPFWQVFAGSTSSDEWSRSMHVVDGLGRRCRVTTEWIRSMKIVTTAGAAVKALRSLVAQFEPMMKLSGERKVLLQELARAQSDIAPQILRALVLHAQAIAWGTITQQALQDAEAEVAADLAMQTALSVAAMEDDADPNGASTAMCHSCDASSARGDGGFSDVGSGDVDGSGGGSGGGSGNGEKSDENTASGEGDCDFDDEHEHGYRYVQGCDIDRHRGTFLTFVKAFVPNAHPDCKDAAALVYAGHMTLTSTSRVFPALLSCAAVCEGLRRAATTPSDAPLQRVSDVLPQAAQAALDEYVMFVEPAPAHCLPSNAGAAAHIWPPPLIAKHTFQASEGSAGTLGTGTASNSEGKSMGPTPWARKRKVACSGGWDWRRTAQAAGICAGDVLVVCKLHELADVGAIFERKAHRILASASRLQDHNVPANGALPTPTLGPETPRSARFGSLTLTRLEAVAEQAGMQPYRLRHSFRKNCHRQLRATVSHALEGRHIDFICDMCGATDFHGPRYKCKVCDNFDLCSKCHHSAEAPTHRYLFKGGKWILERNFHSHTFDHAVDVVLPPFYAHDRWKRG